jgi:hypothetical protein
MGTTRDALIIANNEYADDGLRRLRAPTHDAETLGEVLRSPDIGGFDVRTLLNAPAHEATLAVEEFFADRAPDDLLLLHVSCHGLKDEGGDLYFAASNTLMTRLGATAIPANFVNRCMGRSRSRRIVLLLDCCYAGAFERGMVARAGSSAVAIEEQLGGRGRAVITASSAMEYAFEGGDLQDVSDASPSVFTSALVEGLRTGDADRDQDGAVALDELYEYVYEKVRTETPNQTPGKWVFGVQGDLVIARRARPVTSPAPLAAELQDAVDSPFASVRLAVLPELRRLAAGRHEGRALAARMTLERMTQDDSRMVSEAATAALAERPLPDAGYASVVKPTSDAPPMPAGDGPVVAVTEPPSPPRPATAKRKVDAGSPDVGDPWIDTSTADDLPAAASTSREGGGPRGLAVAAALTAGGAASWLAAMLTPYVHDSNGTAYTIVEAAGTAYAVLVLCGLCAAAVLLIVPATRDMIGPGFLIGVSTGIVSSVVFAILFPHALTVNAEGSSISSAYYLGWLSTLTTLAAALVCVGPLRRQGVGLRRPPRPDGWAARWAVVTLGLISAISLVAQVTREGTLGHDRPYYAPIDLPTLMTDALMLASIATVAATSSPRRFGVAILGGWLVAAASMVAYYLNGRLSVFTATVVAMAAVGVVFARSSKTTTRSGELPTD